MCLHKTGKEREHGNEELKVKKIVGDEMKKQYRFLISYLCNNQPNTIEISCDNDSLEPDEAEEYIKLANNIKAGTISDIQVISLHRPNNPNVHPGHYQQPEG